jgi:hypothetical protein
MLRSLTCSLILALALVGAPAAFAQGDLRPLVVVIEGTPSSSPSDVRLAIANELKAPVVASGDPQAATARGTLTVTFAPEGEEMVVRYRAKNGTREMVRRVTTPASPTDSVRAAALLAGNLARDESAEILQEHEETRQKNQKAAAEAEAKARADQAAAEKAAAEKAEAAKRAGTETRADRCKREHREAPIHPATASFFYPLATNFNRPNVRTPFYLDLIYGRAGWIEGFGAGLFTMVDCDASGLYATSLFGYAGNEMRGLQASGAVAYAGRVNGLQAAGAVALSKGVRGVQTAGGYVQSMEKVTGAQFAPITVANDVEGLQGSVVAVGRDVDGAQLSVVNAGRDVSGVQIGVVNVGRKVKGLQLGVVNVAEEMDGPSIALIPIAKDGAIRPTVFGSVLAFANAGIEFDTRYTFVVLSAGYGGQGAAGNYGVGGFQLGLHAFGPAKARGFFLDPMIGNQTALRVKNNDDELRFLLRVRGGYRFEEHLAAFGGLGAGLVAKFPEDDLASASRDVALKPDVFAGMLF